LAVFPKFSFGARARRAAGVWRIDPAAPDGFTPWQEHPFPFSDLLRQSVYSRLAGYEDLNDAERLSQDPTFRLIGSEKIWDRGAA